MKMDVLLIILTYLIYIHGSKVVVFGGSGKTGSRVVQNLLNSNTFSKIIVPARNIGTARRKLGPDTKKLRIIPCDIRNIKQVSVLETYVENAECVVNCVGFSPGGTKSDELIRLLSLPDPLGPKEVECDACKRLVDACVNQKVKRFVLVSSLLTNGFAAGQLLNPQYLLLNSFGGILMWKREAEKYLQAKCGYITNDGGNSDPMEYSI